MVIIVKNLGPCSVEAKLTLRSFVRCQRWRNHNFNVVFYWLRLCFDSNVFHDICRRTYVFGIISEARILRQETTENKKRRQNKGTPFPKPKPLFLSGEAIRSSQMEVFERKARYRITNTKESRQ